MRMLSLSLRSDCEGGRKERIEGDKLNGEVKINKLLDVLLSPLP